MIVETSAMTKAENQKKRVVLVLMVKAFDVFS